MNAFLAKRSPRAAEVRLDAIVSPSERSALAQGDTIGKPVVLAGANGDDVEFDANLMRIAG